MAPMKKKKEYCFIALFDRFISDSVRGKRLQPNGKRISCGTIANYYNTKNVIVRYSLKAGQSLRLNRELSLSQREIQQERRYWKKFYISFTDYLYGCGYYDNYIGQNIKNIKVFFNYLNKELTLGIGQYHKQFFTRKEEIAIYPLMPEELNYLIYNKVFENGLTPRLREVKDFFVFGCTVALRFSDLKALKKGNVRVSNGHYYLGVRSIKTGTESLIKLSPYAIDIINRYRKTKRSLLPSFNLVNMNIYIKQLLELAGFTHPVYVQRQRRGETIEIKRKEAGRPNGFRFCDVATTHTMRRTAITTMLCLGMQESLVRKIGGYSPSSKDFYRYVSWSQMYIDQEIEKVHDILKTRELNVKTE
jgi:integrase